MTTPAKLPLSLNERGAAMPLAYGLLPSKKAAEVCRSVPSLSSIARVLPSALCVLMLMAWAPARSRAQDRVDVPEGCGSEQELRAELVQLLGAEGARAALPERLQITRAGEGDYALSLELAGESRTMRDADCRALFKTAVVVAAAIVSPAQERSAAAQRRRGARRRSAAAQRRRGARRRSAAAAHRPRIIRATTA
jgi:hypothetical protein